MEKKYEKIASNVNNFRKLVPSPKQQVLVKVKGIYTDNNALKLSMLNPLPLLICTHAVCEAVQAELQ